jgi:hypothetical protein
MKGIILLEGEECDVRILVDKIMAHFELNDCVDLEYGELK